MGAEIEQWPHSILLLAALIASCYIEGHAGGSRSIICALIHLWTISSCTYISLFLIDFLAALRLVQSANGVEVWKFSWKCQSSVLCC